MAPSSQVKEPPGKSGRFTPCNGGPIGRADLGAVGGLILDFTPIIGDAKGFYDAYQDPTPINIAAAIIGLGGPIGDGIAKSLKAADHAADASRALMHGPSPKINLGQQGKHQVGHNNYRPETKRSVLSADPSELGRHAGTGQQVGNIEVGLPGSRERVNFGQEIGTYIDSAGNASPTTNGIIHYGKKGIHIVPARPLDAQ